MLQIENGIERQEAGGATPELPLVGSATKTTVRDKLRHRRKNSRISQISRQKAAQDIDANGDNSSSEEPAQSAVSIFFTFLFDAMTQPHGLNAQGEPLFLHTATTYEELEKVRNAEERLVRCV